MTRTVKILIATNLITLIALGGIALKEKYPQKIISKFRKKEVAAGNGKMFYWLERDNIFESLPADSNGIVFIGTSLTENFELNELLGNCHIKNRGITADHTAGMLNRLDAVIRLHPAKIFIEAGVNDLGKGVEEATLLSNYSAMIDKLQKECPGAKIYVQSILPVANKGHYPEYNNPKVNTAIRNVNAKLNAMAVERSLTYIDVYSSFERNGEINPDYVIADGIHLNGKAYLVWAGALKPYVNE